MDTCWCSLTLSRVFMESLKSSFHLLCFTVIILSCSQSYNYDRIASQKALYHMTFNQLFSFHPCFLQSMSSFKDSEVGEHEELPQKWLRLLFLSKHEPFDSIHQSHLTYLVYHLCFYFQRLEVASSMFEHLLLLENVSCY